MALFDALSGAAYDRANKRNVGAITAGLNQGTGALTETYGNALKWLVDANDPSALGALGQGYGQARSDLTSQYGQTQGYLGQATDAYRPLVTAGQGALGTYYDAIGANGAEGSARAADAFRAAPGYDYAMDQALGAVQRTAAARGGLAGGNATADILKTATGLADQSFQRYIDNLKGGVGTYTTGVQGVAGGLTNQGQASASQGTALGALGTGLGTAQAGVYQTGAGLQAGLGNALAGLTSNATNAFVNNNNTTAKGQTETSLNALGAIIGGADNLMTRVGKAGGFRQLFS